MGEFVKQLFSSSAKAFDVFNLGRLFFYTASGSLAIIPILMIFRLLASDSFPPTLAQSLREVSSLSIFLGEDESLGNAVLIIFLIASIIVGFLIANLGFMVVIRPLKKKLNQRLSYELSNPDKHSIAFQYPKLKNNREGEDYDAWLSTEYFRFVEIAVYIPLGFFIGMIFFAVYVALYFLISLFSNNVLPDETFNSALLLIFLGVVIFILKLCVWEQWWHPQVVKETMLTYLKAKVSLIEGLDALS